MDICIIADKAETKDPGITLVRKRLHNTHTIRTIVVPQLETEAAAIQAAIAEEEQYPLADLYLLITRRAQDTGFAHFIEQCGGHVINNATSTALCQDRALMSKALLDAGVPWPKTWSFPSLDDLPGEQEFPTSFPCVIKSNKSYSGDLVKKIDDIEQLRALAEEWGEEPVILQEFLVGNNWDIKTWAFGENVLAAQRLSRLDIRYREHIISAYQFDEDEIPQEWLTIVHAIGRALNIQVYGVDLLLTAQGVFAMDVNAFHSCYGMIGSDEALLELVERLLEERSALSV